VRSSSASIGSASSADALVIEPLSTKTSLAAWSCSSRSRLALRVVDATTAPRCDANCGGGQSRRTSFRRVQQFFAALQIERGEERTPTMSAASSA